jgi:hypothetical protein
MGIDPNTNYVQVVYDFRINITEIFIRNSHLFIESDKTGGNFTLEVHKGRDVLANLDIELCIPTPIIGLWGHTYFEADFTAGSTKTANWSINGTWEYKKKLQLLVHHDAESKKFLIIENLSLLMQSWEIVDFNEWTQLGYRRVFHLTIEKVTREIERDRELNIWINLTKGNKENRIVATFEANRGSELNIYDFGIYIWHQPTWAVNTGFKHLKRTKERNFTFAIDMTIDSSDDIIEADDFKGEASFLLESEGFIQLEDAYFEYRVYTLENDENPWDLHPTEMVCNVVCEMSGGFNLSTAHRLMGKANFTTNTYDLVSNGDITVYDFEFGMMLQTGVGIPTDLLHKPKPPILPPAEILLSITCDQFGLEGASYIHFKGTLDEIIEFGAGLKIARFVHNLKVMLNITGEFHEFDFGGTFDLEKSTELTIWYEDEMITFTIKGGGYVQCTNLYVKYKDHESYLTHIRPYKAFLLTCYRIKFEGYRMFMLKLGKGLIDVDIRMNSSVYVSSLVLKLPDDYGILKKCLQINEISGMADFQLHAEYRKQDYISVDMHTIRESATDLDIDLEVVHFDYSDFVGAIARDISGSGSVEFYYDILDKYFTIDVSHSFSVNYFEIESNKGKFSINRAHTLSGDIKYKWEGDFLHPSKIIISSDNGLSGSCNPLTISKNNEEVIDIVGTFALDGSIIIEDIEYESGALSLPSSFNIKGQASGGGGTSISLNGEINIFGFIVKDVSFTGDLQVDVEASYHSDGTFGFALEAMTISGFDGEMQVGAEQGLLTKLLPQMDLTFLGDTLWIIVDGKINPASKVGLGYNDREDMVSNFHGFWQGSVELDELIIRSDTNDIINLDLNSAQTCGASFVDLGKGADEAGSEFYYATITGEISEMNLDIGPKIFLLGRMITALFTLELENVVLNNFHIRGCDFSTDFTTGKLLFDGIATLDYLGVGGHIGIDFNSKHYDFYPHIGGVGASLDAKDLYLFWEPGSFELYSKSGTSTLTINIIIPGFVDIELAEIQINGQIIISYSGENGWTHTNPNSGNTYTGGSVSWSSPHGLSNFNIDLINIFEDSAEHVEIKPTMGSFNLQLGEGAMGSVASGKSMGPNDVFMWREVYLDTNSVGIDSIEFEFEINENIKGRVGGNNIVADELAVEWMWLIPVSMEGYVSYACVNCYNLPEGSTQPTWATQWCGSTGDPNGVIAHFDYYPEPGIVEEDVLFDAHNSQKPEGNITQYEWDFDNDGTYEEVGGPLTHMFRNRTYYTIGDYLVRLRVTDEEGNTDTFAKQVQIRDSNFMLDDFHAAPNPALIQKINSHAGHTMLFATVEGGTAPFTYEFKWEDPWAEYDPFYNPYPDGWRGDIITSDSRTASKQTFGHYPDAGYYSATVDVMDSEGNTVMGDTEIAFVHDIFLVDANGPYYGHVGQSIHFEGDVDNVDPWSILEYKWEFGDGSSEGFCGLCSEADHTYQLAHHEYCDTYEPFEVKFKARKHSDETSTTTDTTQAYVSYLSAHVMNNPGPLEYVNTPITVKIDGRGTYAQEVSGESIHYRIDWGDGEVTNEYTQSTSINPSHSYTQTGQFTINIQITDLGYTEDVDNPVSITVKPLEVTTGAFVYGINQWRYADQITETSARLYGELDEDGGEACEFFFLYRVKNSGDSWTQTRYESGGTTEWGAPSSFHLDVTGLDPGTTYEYKVKGTNSYGSDEDVTYDFTTLGGDFVITINNGETVYEEDPFNVHITNSVTGGNVIGAEVRFYKKITVGYSLIDTGITGSNGKVTFTAFSVGLVKKLAKIEVEKAGFYNDDKTFYVHPGGGSDNQAPTADAGGPYNGCPGDTITFDGSGSHDNDENGQSIVLYEWDLDNDGYFDDATGETASRSFSSPGTYTIGLKVWDDDGGLTDTDTTTVSIGGSSPIAKIYGPGYGEKNEDLDFDGYDSEPPCGETIGAYDWYGRKSGDLVAKWHYDEGPTFTVNYATNGQKTIKLKVWNEDETEYDMVTKTIQISGGNNPVN